ncbi:MAG: glutamate-5-semialdehyde dehydrogenase [Archangiaceae bacterium]|nr:glutamate-5-semialdehyde dehydrogenase [Archangiaceae bacterium]
MHRPGDGREPGRPRDRQAARRGQGEEVRQLAQRAKVAARTLSHASTKQKDQALAAIARELLKARGEIEAANALDLSDARAEGKNEAFLDRLKVNVAACAAAVRAVRKLDDPVGKVTRAWKRPNGLKVRKVRLPLGVLLMIYESRPNVTTDAAALALKSGNAVILRGGKESLRTNTALAEAIRRGLAGHLSEDAVQLVPTADRESLLALLKLDGLIDLCIPRGGEGLIRFVAEHARIPVVKHYQGVCHVYVHAQADLKKAQGIIVNAKTSRPGVCNAAECLLVDEKVAPKFLPSAAKALLARGVELRGDARTVELLPGLPVVPAQEGDFGREFLELKLAVRVVDGLDQALDHIARYGSEHTEAIVTKSKAAAQRFEREVCASAVIWNASTRFNDGAELGLGTEVGISTSRLHAFGPMGLEELTAQKFVVEGNGQVR